MKKLSIWSLLFALSINAVLLILAYNFTLGYHLEEAKKNSLKDITYDNRSNDPQIKSFRSYSEQLNASVNDISIHFKINARNIASVGDIFQTAPQDRGIRMELDKGVLNLIINTKSAIPRYIHLISNVQPDVDYPIVISVDRNNKLKVMIGSWSGEATDNNLRFEISDIAIGTGFSKSRPFDGVISDFSLEYSLYNPVEPGYYSALRFSLLVSMLTLFCLLFYTFSRTPEVLNRKTKITLASAIILTGFITAVFFRYIMGAYLNKAYPYNTFLSIPAGVHSASFDDFFTMLTCNKDLNPYYFGSNYYPFANIIFFIFSHIETEVSFLLFCFAFVIPFFLLNKHYLSIDARQNMVNLPIFTLLTLPFLITIDRGNIESMVFVFTALFIYYFQKNKSVPACIFLSMAIAMKLFPAAFLILLFAEKKYKDMAITLALTVLISVISLSFFKNGFFHNLQFILSGFGVADNNFFKDTPYLQRGVSLFTLVKLILIKSNLIHSVEVSSILSMYVKTSFVVFGLVVAYIYFIEKDFWQKVSLITFTILLLPHMSAEYKLLYIFIPMYLFVNNENVSKLNLFYLLSFTLLLVPKDYFYFREFRTDTDAIDFSINNVINIFILIMMTVVIMANGLLYKDKMNNPILPAVAKSKKVRK